MRIAVFTAVGLLAGCVTASEVVPAGRDSYMVQGHASGGLNAGKGAVAALQKANAYCATQQKFVLIRNTDSHGIAAIGGESNSLIFSCVTADDPEYQRPTLRKDNGVTTIENR
jgi:hypothetical protein